MSKLTSIASDYSRKEYKDDMENDRGIAYLAFIEGFKEASEEFKTFLEQEKERIKGYGYMGERIHVMGLLQRKIDEIMKEMEE